MGTKDSDRLLKWIALLRIGPPDLTMDLKYRVVGITPGFRNASMRGPMRVFRYLSEWELLTDYV